MIVEVRVERSHVELDVRMRLLEHLHAFGRGHQREEQDALAGHATALEHVDGVRGRVARRDHRIAKNEGAVLEVGQTHEIFDRAMVVGAVHADMTHARRRDQLQQPVGHAHARAQHGHDGELLARDHGRVDLDERRLHAARRDGKLTRDFIAHQQRDLAQQLAERARGRVLVAHMRELVLDQRVIEDEEIRETAVLFHGGAHKAARESGKTVVPRPREPEADARVARWRRARPAARGKPAGLAKAPGRATGASIRELRANQEGSERGKQRREAGVRVAAPGRRRPSTRRGRFF
ncbi:hypothetical protein PUN4_1040032 [Paraburkholderia unamae]|nr:hypothetical protein PUN4_1040032 [Paraburkholderia unamae]